MRSAPLCVDGRRERRKERERIKKERARRERDADKDGVPSKVPVVAEVAVVAAPVEMEEPDEVDEAAIMASLGFGGFSTTKVGTTALRCCGCYYCL